MIKITLEKSTLKPVIASLYCMSHDVNPLAIPEEIWTGILEKLEEYLVKWDYSLLSVEEWISHYLTILPMELIDESDLKFIKENTVYWEYANGNAVLCISMDVSVLE